MAGVGRGARGYRLPGLLGRRPALAVHPLLHRAGLGRGLLPAGLPAHRRRGRAGLRRRRRGALQHRRGRLRLQAAQPVAALVRLPRGLPLAHAGRLHRPLRRHLAGGLQPRLSPASDAPAGPYPLGGAGLRHARTPRRRAVGIDTNESYSLLRVTFN
ncbi:hypothetical protein SCOCK_240113 [Actinacidiphila cocklensis]|uniref:Uncharacterized protein n=1 Tax=Actinacidiphila cocklensis TaxID=887465 RepID=A0A9W4E6T8_9ACTN|nr:hypothetical protein SCOCK_240113 [Actinacidiphila cocklensis]